jgi:ABC-2 type transport system permease protein
MRNLLTIWHRELKACFLSPVAYVSMVLFVMATGSTFLVAVLKNAGSSEPLTSLLFASVVVWMTLLITVISMRLFAEERRSGTIETLMTAPVTEWEVVMGKYAGALTFLVVVTAPVIGSAYVLAALSPGIQAVDAGAMAGGSLILLLVSSFCLSVGLCLSMLTRNQIVAAICVFCAVWGILLFGWLVSFLPLVTSGMAEYLSAMAHIEDFSRGSLDTRPVVMYLSGTAFALFAAVRIFETRRWR